MGYTIYWEKKNKKDFSLEFQNAVKEILEEMRKENVVIRGPYGDGEPIVSSDFIGFNGCEKLNEDHESFWFKSQNAGFNFCKTQRKPYTPVVARVLLLAKKYGYIETLSHDDDDNYWEKIGVYNNLDNSYDALKTTSDSMSMTVRMYYGAPDDVADAIWEDIDNNDI